MKALQQLTIIPKDLYVERAADRQVESILSNMGRPGYVLVARQMGKTNLLLNARDKARGNADSFTYLDASNELPDIREFFRNIIDLTLATSTVSPDAESEIEQARATQARLPHKEHEWELRCVLRHTSGKLIICLDEIDALTRTDYSDQVFAFIRSVYFSGRANFPEFARLTYLLSGVAEPADIIKNKDISPFNIGEKIYLDDFTLLETQELLGRARVALPTNVVNRVHSWVSGYPRMTWDVCSALEDLAHNGAGVSEGDVDKLIRSLYFSEVDAPPIDHIKRLVEESTTLQDAIMSIHYNKSESISDSTKTKLYLVGVTKMVTQDARVQFKNRVLEEALSETFIQSISKKSFAPQLAEIENIFNLGDYEAALSELEKIQGFFLESERRKGLRIKALCYFRIPQFSESLRILSALANEGLDGRELLEVTLYRGICHARLEEYSDAESILTAIALSDSPMRFEAQIELASAALRAQADTKQAESWCLNLISQPGLVTSIQPLTRSVAEILSWARMILADIARNRQNNDMARNYLEEALNYATADLKVRIYMQLFDIDNGQRRAIYIKQGAAIVRACELFALSAEGLQNCVSVDQLFSYLSHAELVGRQTELDEGIASAYRKRETGLTPQQIVEHLVLAATKRGSAALTIKILERALVGSEVDIDTEARRQFLGLAFLVAPSKIGKLSDAYLKTFSADHQASINDVIPLIQMLINGSAWLSSATLDTVVEILNRDPIEFSTLLSEERQSLELVRQYAISFKALRGGATPGDVTLARSVLVKMTERAKLDLPNLSSSYFRSMLVALHDQLKRFGSTPSLKRERKIGRNEIVEVSYQGTVRRGKYKKFEQDIAIGACSLVGRVDDAAKR